MAHMVLFDEAFNAADSCLQLPPARTKNGRAPPFPVLEPSRQHVAHSHRMVCPAHDNYLDIITTQEWRSLTFTANVLLWARNA